MENGYKIIAGAIILLGVSILGHGWIITDYALRNDLKTTSIVTAQDEDKDIMSLSEAAIYLNLSEDQVAKIMNREQEEINKTGSFTGMMFPYIKVEGKLIFSKKALDKWAEEASIQRKEYLLY